MRTVTARWNAAVKAEYKVKRGSVQWRAVVSENSERKANGLIFEIKGYMTKTGNQVVI